MPIFDTLPTRNPRRRRRCVVFIWSLAYTLINEACSAIFAVCVMPECRLRVCHVLCTRSQLFSIRFLFILVYSILHTRFWVTILPQAGRHASRRRRRRRFCKTLHTSHNFNLIKQKNHADTQRARPRSSSNIHIEMDMATTPMEALTWRLRRQRCHVGRYT